MFPVAVAGDLCGGPILAVTQLFVRINGLPIVVVGDPITSHGSGVHLAATMAFGSLVVRINGIPICRTGDAATCGHTATGTSHVNSA